MPREKRLDFELLRIIAIVGVVFNHTQLRGFELYQVSSGGVNFYGSLLLGILCKVAVPLFLMVSGGLLLQREEGFRQMGRRVGRIAAALVLFSCVEYFFLCRWGDVETPGVIDFLRRLWHDGMTIPYWYLYCYLGLMLMLPLLRPMVRGMGNRAFVYLIVLHTLLYGVCGSVALLLELGKVHGDLLVPMVEPYVFYFLMGYYFAHRFSWEDFSKKRLAGLWGMAVAVVAAMLGLAVWSVSRYGQICFSYHESLMFLPVFAIYQTVCWFFRGRKVPGIVEKLLIGMGGCTFGVYLLEGILRHYLVFLYEALEPAIHVLPACFVWVLAVVLCGMGITWALKKLPVLKKIL